MSGGDEPTGQSNGLLDDRINIRGYFERILVERDRAEVERDKRLDERFRAQETALAAALTERDRSLAAALAAAKEAVEKAEIANEKRFESANEWRGQSADRERTQQEQLAIFSATLLPRESFDTFKTNYDQTLRTLEHFQARILGGFFLVTMLMPIVIGVLIYFITKH